MSRWDPNNICCKNCKTKMDQTAEQDGEWALWCPSCGTILTANEFDDITDTDWKIPSLSKSFQEMLGQAMLPPFDPD